MLAPAKFYSSQKFANETLCKISYTAYIQHYLDQYIVWIAKPDFFGQSALCRDMSASGAVQGTEFQQP